MTKQRAPRQDNRIAQTFGLTWEHQRYHRAQVDPTIDTAAKRLARQAGLDTVRCPCGAEFPSDVHPKRP